MDKDLREQWDQKLLQQELAEGEPEKDLKLAQWQLDLRAELDELGHSWRGDILEQEEGGKWVWKNYPDNQVMTEEGIRKITSFMWTANRNMFLSNMDEKQIDRLMLFFSFALTDFLLMNYRRFKIEHSNLTMVKETIQLTIYPALKRAQAGGERDSLRKTQKSVELTGDRNSSGGEQKKSFISKIFRRGGN